MSDLSRDDMAFADRIAIGADLTEDDHRLETPPPHLWERIEAEADQLVAGPPWRRRRQLILAAAAVVLVVAAVTAIALQRSGSDSRLVAETAIVNDGLPVSDPGAGSAELREVDGRLVLDVDVPDLPTSGGFLELWIIDADVAGMYSLGVVNGDGRYPLPGGVDPAEFPVVDISVEPTDGDPTHSGQSIWRGVLDL